MGCHGGKCIREDFPRPLQILPNTFAAMATHFRHIIRVAILCVCLFRQSFAFSLLGPFAPWMTPDVGFIHDEAYDVGGPRNLGDEFRWNVPVLTYGFDQNFK